ncbi:PREDICTED: P2Y purinoceptor 1-like [Thamnophis sirtalis]|uniref:P2Y purinoceptor 1-like n=1 Tax=Thamnophis sirtalis TaxID=35019 RepID=A0A6I9XXP0_9SAUR|nr:PREDICTED: P2Y purinoceptor 1-like [Thamnophis sirtalis]
MKEVGNQVNNSTNNSICDIDDLCPVNIDFTQWFLPTFYLILSVLGLLGNTLGLWSLCRSSRKKSWNPFNVLLCNLAFADLSYVITLPFFVSYYLGGHVWVFGQSWCKLTRLFFHVNLYASIGFLTCISVHRYLHIVHPMKMIGRCQNLGFSVFLSVLVWLWVTIQLSPDLTFNKRGHMSDKCHDSTEHKYLETYLLYFQILTVTGFAIPFFIVTGCYCHVVLVLRRNKNMDPNLKQKSIKLVIMVMTLFYVCFLPYHIFRNLNFLSRRWQCQGFCNQTLKNIYIFYQVTRVLASLNSVLNPLLYLLAREDLEVQLRKFARNIRFSLKTSFEDKLQPHLELRQSNIMLDKECGETLSSDL